MIKDHQVMTTKKNEGGVIVFICIISVHFPLFVSFSSSFNHQGINRICSGCFAFEERTKLVAFLVRVVFIIARVQAFRMQLL